jgi:hypothetical protein
VAWGRALFEKLIALAQKLRQLRHVDRNPPRLISAEQLGC